jgi:hypothetical protein
MQEEYVSPTRRLPGGRRHYPVSSDLPPPIIVTCALVQAAVQKQHTAGGGGAQLSGTNKRQLTQEIPTPPTPPPPSSPITKPEDTLPWQRDLTTGPVLGQISAFRKLRSHFRNIRFNILLPYKTKSSKWFLRCTSTSKVCIIVLSISCVLQDLPICPCWFVYLDIYLVSSKNDETPN